MRKVILNESEEKITLSTIPSRTLIAAEKDGELVGAVMKESNGWILRYVNGGGCNGHHKERRRCLETAFGYGFTFYTK